MIVKIRGFRPRENSASANGGRAAVNGAAAGITGKKQAKKRPARAGLEGVRSSHRDLELQCMAAWRKRAGSGNLVPILEATG
ncbi:hypothetical protein [Janthinobacterium agaricidamnosum]|uniref:hypothetical protein n=1 Tax=Janthinobacterium agaricidamnosum TaxID=55508 RepID=UPI0013CF19DF|nr:hypothetical protein [Janthinobacterium agaricidamnosum]